MQQRSRSRLRSELVCTFRLIELMLVSCDLLALILPLPSIFGLMLRPDFGGVIVPPCLVALRCS